MYIPMVTLSIMNSNNMRNCYKSSKSESFKKNNEVKSSTHTEYVFDVMKSRYSKQVIKTYKTRRGGENYIKNNNLDTVLKVRKIEVENH